MIRTSTFLWVGLAGALGVGVYQMKHQMLAQESVVQTLNRQIVEEQRAIHVLRAEWAYLNQPQRLQALAQRHLDMRQLAPGQIGRTADLPRRPTDPSVASAPPGVPGSDQSARPSLRAAAAQPVPSPGRAPRAEPARAEPPRPALARARSPQPAGVIQDTAAPVGEPGTIDALLAQMRQPPEAPRRR